MNWPEILSGFVPGAVSVGSTSRLIVPVLGRDVLVAQPRSNLLIDEKQAHVLRPFLRESVHIGQWEGVDCVAWQLADEVTETGGFERVGLRAFLLSATDFDFRIAARAVQLLDWRQHHRFCGQCGQPTRSGAPDHSMVCDSCSISFYPRISPCVIVVVVNGDHCLLAHNKSWPSGWYSALAGFIEPGESVEQAMHREIYEEVGVHIHRERYIGSQAWPFPGQLMLGYLADYRDGKIRVDNIEIEHAQWWRYDALPNRPMATTLSGRLIDHFVEEASAVYG